MPSLKRRPSGRTPRAVAEDVEPRILYSADAGVLAYAPSQEFADTVQVQSAQPQAATAEQQTEQRSNRLVVLDDSLPDLDLLVNDLEQQREQGASIHILLIDAQADGLTQVTEFLQSTSERFTELHIVSHGDDAQFELGNVTVDESIVRARAAEFAQWDAALTNDADLLIYGCDFSASAQGESLAISLSVLTGSDVASSVDDTGHASLGANWTLESATGSIQSVQLFSDSVINSWTHELSVVPGPVEGNPGNTQIDTPGTDAPTLDSNAGNRQIDSNGTITVVVWELNDEVYFRVMDADDPSTGTPTAIENDPTTPVDRWAPAVAVAADGTFMVVWTSADQNGTGGGTSGVYGQFFDSTGTPIARPADAYGEKGDEYKNPFEFRLNEHVPPSGQHTEDYDQEHPSVVATPAGGFFVSWTSQEEVNPSPVILIDQVRLTRFLADGSRDAVVEAVEVNAIPNLGMNRSVLAVNPTNGDLYMASEVFTLGGSEVELYSVDTSTGLSTGILHNVNPTDFGEQGIRPRLDVNSSGQWVMAVRWQNAQQTHFFHSDAASNSLGFLSNSENADVAIRDNGNAIVVAQIENVVGPTTSQDITIRSVRPTGESSVVYVPHSHDPGLQLNPGIVLHGDTAAVIWDGENETDTDAIMIHNMAVVDPAAELVVDAAATNENGGQVNVAVRLSAPPNGIVTVTATVSNAAEARIVGSADLMFDVTNWDTDQSIVVEGVADGVVDPNVNYDVNFSFAATDGLFQFAPTQTFALVNLNVDVPTISDDDTALDQVAENAAAGTAIGLTVSANVPGTSFQIDGASTASLIFDIEPNTGVVTVSDSTLLDAESNLPNPATITVPVVATSGAWSQVQNFSVSIADINDNTPIISAPTSLSIAEGVVGPLTPSMSATDIDFSPTTFTWSLSVPAPYDVGYVSINSATGVISVDTAFDAEDAGLPNPLPLTVMASDGVNSSSVNVNLVIVEANDEAPVITSTAPLTVVENDSTFTAQMTATDADTAQAGLTWSITGGSAAPYFTVNASGALTVTTMVDYESLPENPMQLNLSVTDGVQSDSIGLIINPVDVNDHSPIVIPGQSFTVSESATNSTILGVVQSSDADLVAANPAPTVTLQATTSGGANVPPPFSILPNGTIQVSDQAQLDFDTFQTYELQVRIDDGGNIGTVGSVQISLNNFNYLPIGADGAVTVTEDTPRAFLAEDFPFVDDDVGDTFGGIQIVSVPAHGQLTSNGILLTTANTSPASPQVVDVSDIGNLIYTPGEDSNLPSSFDYLVMDQAGVTAVSPSELTINIAPVNDLPQISGSGRIGVMVGESVAITTGMLSAADIESGPTELTFTLVSTPQHGLLLLNGAAISSGGNFTQAQLAAGQITYESLASTDSIEQVVFELRDSDGGTDTELVNIETTGGTVITTPVDNSGDGSASQPDDDNNLTSIDNPVISSPQDDESRYGTSPSGAPSLAGPDDSVDQDSDRGVEEPRAKPQIILAYQISYQNTDYEGYRVSELQTEYESVSQVGNTRERPDFGFGNKFEMTDFRQSMKTLEESMSNFGVQLDRQFVASTAVVSTGMSIGYVLWLMRGGALLSSIIASMPAWRSIDPLPVLASLGSADDGKADDDSLEAMLEKSPPPPPPEIEEDVEVAKESE